MTAKHAVWLGLLVRVGMATWNSLVGPTPGADADAATFHRFAVDFSSGLTLEGRDATTFAYAYALGQVYRVTGASLLVGSLLSCAAWLASARVLMRIARLMSIRRRRRFRIMLVYALLPSSILWTSVTLREPYQLLCVNLALLAALKIYLNRPGWNWSLLVSTVAVGSVLHGVLFGFGVFALIGSGMWVLFRKRPDAAVLWLMMLVPLSVALLTYGYSLFNDLYRYSVDQGLSAAVQTYQQGGLNSGARTDYRDTISIDGVGGLLWFIPVATFQYLFEPMPWRLGAPVDAVFLIENCLRAALLWTAVSGFRRMDRETRPLALLLFASYVVLETAWSLGTVNWGTAARHHIPSLGLLLAVAFANGRPKRSRHPRSHGSLQLEPAG